MPRRFELSVTPVRAENTGQQNVPFNLESQWEKAKTYILTLLSLVVEVVRVSVSEIGSGHIILHLASVG